MRNSPTLALIGCGAISEAVYLPALAGHSQWCSGTWLVEPNAARGHALAKQFGFPLDQVVSNHDELPDAVGLAINATPSHLHRAITARLIERRFNILVEKPFAETAEDARALNEAASGRCLLSVNQSRRAGPSNALIRDLLRSGTLGRLERITWSEGRPFDWPTQSGFNFRRPWQGRPRGVLLDIGVHVLDLLCWWAGSTPELVSATLDGQGGPEASASAQLTLGEAVVDLRLSYLAKLENEVLIEGTTGAIRASTADYERIDIRIGRSAWRTLKARGSINAIENTRRLIGNVLAAAANEEPLMIDAASTIPALDVIDTIYAGADTLLSKCYGEHVMGRLPASMHVAQEMLG